MPDHGSVSYCSLTSSIAAAGEGPSAAPKRSNIVQMPDEYLPPNKILFIQNLPEIITKEDLENIFKAYPNLHDVRLIPGRKGIAFVEYTDEASSTVAREALHNYKVDDEHKMKVSRILLVQLSQLKLTSCFTGHVCKAIVQRLGRTDFRMYCIIMYHLVTLKGTNGLCKLHRNCRAPLDLNHVSA